MRSTILSARLLSLNANQRKQIEAKEAEHWPRAQCEKKDANAECDDSDGEHHHDKTGPGQGAMGLEHSVENNWPAQGVGPDRRIAV